MASWHRSGNQYRLSVHEAVHDNSLPFQERGDGKCWEFQMSRAGIEPATRCLKGMSIGHPLGTNGT
jgi:hypothetical protein